jgi:hypothetical protein
MATYAIDRLLTHAVEHDWAGYYTRFWPIGDLDPVSAYLSRASWRAETTPESAYAQHAGALYGSAAIGPFGQAMRLLEDATVILDMNHLGFMFPVQDCMTSRMGADKGQVMTEDLWHVLSLYEEVKAILSKTLPSIQSEAARAHMRYWIGRLDFGVQILFGMACIGDGNVALKDGDETLARAKYDEALVNFRQALEALAHNVRDDSDRGTLAVYYDMLVREVARVAHQEGR